MQRKIGLAITTRNRREDAQYCIQRILQHTVAEKVVIVDDSSEEPFECNDPRAKVIYNAERLGIAKSKNICLRELRDYDHIFLFDDDCFPLKSGFENAYIDTARALGYPALNFTWQSKHNGNEIYYHRVIEREHKMRRYVEFKRESIEIPLGSFPSEEWLRDLKCVKHETSFWDTHRIVDIPEFSVKIHENPHGCMLYLSREAIDAIGGYDEDYGIYGAEHADLFRRLYNMGKIRKLYPDLDNSLEFLDSLERLS